MKTSESKYCKCMYFSANALARIIEKLAGDCWKKVNLFPSHAYLLMVVLEYPGVQPGVLADELQLTPTTITRLIEKLEEKKLVVGTTERKSNECLSRTKSKRIVSKTEGMQ
jgi:DNA-binding MarR family transcriptional regulator